MWESDLFVHAAAVCAPGLADWPAAAPVLQGREPYRAGPLAVPLPCGLPANEQRRVMGSVRLALHAAAGAIAGTELADDLRLRAVFACSGGNAEALEAVLAAIAQPRGAVSPRHFSHLDHNAAAGYWAIVRGPASVSVSLGAFDGSFAAGLLEAAVACVDDPRVLLVAYDVPPPAPLQPFRPVHTSFAAALLLGGEPQPGTARRWRYGFVPEQPEASCADPGLERLRRENPAARCLPLLALLAAGEPGAVVLPYLPGQCLRVEQRPC
ncbi:MAG TPA: beta-ketoacyl synthase chain length factor [Rhodospirillales bacterium]|nr:beta-ketoacyl synthase chain length factor [Rhodospirillales bacterium]